MNRKLQEKAAAKRAAAEAVIEKVEPAPSASDATAIVEELRLLRAGVRDLADAVRGVGESVMNVGLALVTETRTTKPGGAPGLVGQTRHTPEPAPEKQKAEPAPKQKAEPAPEKKQKATLAEAQKAVSALIQGKTVGVARALLRERFGVERVSEVPEKSKQDPEAFFASVVAACEEALR